MSATSFALHAPFVPRGIVALPIRTRLVKAGDDIPALVREATAGITTCDDVICVSETIVAIAQGRSIPAEAIRPSKLACLLSQRAGSYATMNQPESMQLVLEQAGTLRVLAAAAVGAAGRIIGRRGDFYRLLGSAVAEIDGYTGTMPPYERHIVLGPKDPHIVAQTIAQVCAAHACVVDANDLGRAHVLGASTGVRTDLVQRCLLHNPAGNSDQQTPIVVLKVRPPRAGADMSPLVEAV